MSELTKNVQPLQDFNWDEFENGTHANVSKEELDKFCNKYDAHNFNFYGSDDCFYIVLPQIVEKDIIVAGMCSKIEIWDYDEYKKNEVKAEDVPKIQDILTNFGF